MEALGTSLRIEHNPLFSPLLLLSLWGRVRHGQFIKPAHWILIAVGAFFAAIFQGALYLNRWLQRRFGSSLEFLPGDKNGQVVLWSGFGGALFSSSQVLSATLTPEPTLPGCLRLTLVMEDRWGSRAGQWSMLTDDLQAIREFEHASGLRIQGWEELGIPEVAASGEVGS